MFELPRRALDVADQVERFFQRRVLPNNKLWEQQARAGQAIPDIQHTLRKEAKALLTKVKNYVNAKAAA